MSCHVLLALHLKYGLVLEGLRSGNVNTGWSGNFGSTKVALGLCGDNVVGLLQWACPCIPLSPKCHSNANSIHIRMSIPGMNTILHHLQIVVSTQACIFNGNNLNWIASYSNVNEGRISDFLRYAVRMLPSGYDLLPLSAKYVSNDRRWPLAQVSWTQQDGPMIDQVLPGKTHLRWRIEFQFVTFMQILVTKLLAPDIGRNDQAQFIRMDSVFFFSLSLLLLLLLNYRLPDENLAFSLGYDNSRTINYWFLMYHCIFHS